jgi:hypothetical protein
MPDGMAVKIGGENPWAYPEGSTNTIWEHVFYSGTTNGAFAYPQPTNGTAVLSVTVSGEGSGELVVGGTVVPLLAPPQMRSGTTSSTLAVPVVKGVTHPVYTRADGSLSVTFGSGQFAFGILPSASAGVWSGRINFPNTEATVPCIHDLNRCVVHVSLPASADAGALTCTWIGTEAVEAENWNSLRTRRWTSGTIWISFIKSSTSSRRTPWLLLPTGNFRCISTHRC